MAKLTDTQLVILNAAAQRPNGAVSPVPDSLTINKAAIATVLRSLIGRNLIEERPARLDDVVWKERDEGRFTLVITADGLTALGIEPGGAPDDAGNSDDRRGDTVSEPAADQDSAGSEKRSSKQLLLLNLLRHADGVTVPEAMTATGWQAHSVRGAISTLKKKLGLTVASDKTEDRGRVYRIVEMV